MIGDRNGALVTQSRINNEESSVEMRTSDRAADLGSGRRRHCDPHENRNALSPRQEILMGLELFVSLCGLGGGIYMATHPLTTMSLRYLEGTWFHTWRWPGLALIFFVGVCPALVVIATLLGRHAATIGHVCVGTGLVAWVALEAAWMVVSPGLQIAFGLVGGLIVALALRGLLRSPSRYSK